MVKVITVRPARPIPQGESVTGVDDGDDGTDWEPDTTTGIPPGEDPGDVLTWDGDSWEPAPGGTAGDFLTKNEGGQDFIDDDSFPNAGATGDYDPTDGNVFSRTLNANHTGTILAPVGDGASTLEWWIDTGAGGFTFELESDGGTVAGDISAHSVAAGEVFRVIAERVPGSSNDWIVDLLGVGSSLTPATTVEDETTWGITPAVGTDLEYARQDHTHGTPDEPTGGTGIGPILISDTPSTPLVFADLIQNEAQNDLVYADT